MTKQVNYPDSLIATMTQLYQSATNEAERIDAIKKIANDHGKTVNSVVAKLAGLKIYIKPVKAKAKGVITLRKNVIASEIGAMSGLTEKEVESLAKCTKAVLEKLSGRLKAHEMNIQNYERELQK